MTTTSLVGFILLFLFVGVFFVAFHLLLGRLVRPIKPTPEKQTIYECGEPTIGSAWVQFDLRYYVVALLFVIFDVEVAFFFPWAVVFGQATMLTNDRLDALAAIDPPEKPFADQAQAFANLVPEPRPSSPDAVKERQRRTAIKDALAAPLSASDINRDAGIKEVRAGARRLARIALVDILVFFGVLLVGFAYLWKRGDLAWVRSTAAEQRT